VRFVAVKTPAVAVAASGEEFEFFDPLLGIIGAAQAGAESASDETPHLHSIMYVH
jgi:L-lactate permease